MKGRICWALLALSLCSCQTVRHMLQPTGALAPLPRSYDPPPAYPLAPLEHVQFAPLAPPPAPKEAQGKRPE